MGGGAAGDPSLPSDEQLFIFATNRLNSAEPRLLFHLYFIQHGILKRESVISIFDNCMIDSLTSPYTIQHNYVVVANPIKPWPRV